MSNRRLTQFYYTLHNKPVQIDCNFVVDAANGNGLGIRNLKGPGVQNVYMHTSATPAAGNPNPQAGVILVQFQDNYNRYYGGFSGQVSPVSGAAIAVTAIGAALTPGNVYTITTLGTTTTADWVTLGVPVGTTPSVGVSFIALATGAGTGSGKVMVPATAGSAITHVEVIGDPNRTINSSGAAILGGASGSYIVLGCYDVTPVLTAPAVGSVIGLTFVFSNSSILNQSE